MRDLWFLPTVAKWEKSCGKHPTQKTLPLLSRIIMASTKEHAWILDPFAGSSTTGIAASLLNRRFLGIDYEEAEVEEKKKIEKSREDFNDFLAEIKFKYEEKHKSKEEQEDEQESE